VPSGKNRNSGNPGAARPSKSPTSRPGDGAASRPSSRAEAKSTSPSQRAKSNEILPPPGPQVTSRSRGSDSPPSLQSMAASQRPQAIDESAIPASITPSHRSRANEIPPPAIAALSRPPSAGDAAPALHGGSTRPRASEAPPASQSVHAPEPAAAARMSSAPARATSAPAVVARVNLAPASAGQSVRPRSEPPVPAEPAQPLPAEALTSIDLRKRLDDPALRMDAIFELCRRGHPAAITPIFKVLGSLSPEDVATTVVCMLALGAGVSGGLVECLDSPSQDVRHAAALGLGQLKVPETLLPLLRRIETETTPSWTEMARALGDYGGPALAIVVRALPSSDRRERLMVGLAHLANHGCAEDLKNLENDPDSAVALASRQALARCTRMQAEDVAVRTQLPLRDNSPEARFSQVFFATLAAAG
jgi:hypothetical protein